ncbi:MAG: type II toxin-antitoxin system RelE/ParE family toxin [Candidatus Melainabacteria bacterium]|nr:type II toxin-antitoxin system RelE/ParE family toxin [Candidatus Melainabacteria bacterium]
MQRRYTISYTPRAERDLEKFRKRYWKSYRDFLTILATLELDPYAVGIPLKGNYKGLYALHFGRKPECRAIYEIKDELIIVIVLKIGTRENFYDLF